MRQTKYSAFLLGVFLGGGPAVAAPDADGQKANALFRLAFEGRCAKDAFSADKLDRTEGETFTYRDSGEPSGPEYKSTIYTFWCDRYNNAGSTAFVLKDNEGKFQILTFAVPMVKWTKDPKAPHGLRDDGLQGFTTSDILMNGEFSIDGLTIWSGKHDDIGDYYTNYQFIDGLFQFTDDERYEIKNGKLELKPPEDDDEEEAQ